MKKTKLNIKLLLSAFLLSFVAINSCQKEKTKALIEATDDTIKTDSLTPMETALLPGEKLKAAKMYSELKEKNIALDSVAVTLNSVVLDSEEKAYLVFNEDQSKAEIFLPGETQSAIFERKGTEGNYTWTDGKNELIQWKGYVLRTLKKGTPLFAGDSK